MFFIDWVRVLPNFKGKQRFIRYFIKKYISEKNRLLLTGKYNLKYKLPNIIDSIGFEIYTNGIYEAKISKIIINEIPPNGIFVDVGASIGSISLPVCRMRPDITAICIEASPKIFDYLKFNFDLNKLSNCILINKAISDKDEELLYINETDYFGQGHMTNNKTEKTGTVMSNTLDTVLKDIDTKKVDILKIDIEGYEYFAFKGAEKLLTSEKAPNIIFEFEDWAESRMNLAPGDAQSLLMQYGYSLFHLQHNKKQTPLHLPLTKGSAMIFAKREIK
jgi:FkbM family methyltransferase